LFSYNQLQHTATHCNTLQHNVTHCNTLQHTAYLQMPALQPPQNSGSCSCLLIINDWGRQAAYATSICTYIDVCVYICKKIYIYIYIHIHKLYIYTYIYKYTNIWYVVGRPLMRLLSNCMSCVGASKTSIAGECLKGKCGVCECAVCECARVWVCECVSVWGWVRRLQNKCRVWVMWSVWVRLEQELFLPLADRH